MSCSALFTQFFSPFLDLPTLTNITVRGRAGVGSRHLGVMNVMSLNYINPMQTGLFFFASWDKGGGGGGIRRPYTCNSIIGYDMATKFTHNDVLIISII